MSVPPPCPLIPLGSSKFSFRANVTMLLQEWNFTSVLPMHFPITSHFINCLKADTRANSNASSKIPYATEQGIISAEQGILVQEQGIFPVKSEIITG